MRPESTDHSGRTSVGPGRVLLAVYVLFVVAAGSRGAVQLATHASRAPLAYGLSALASVVYVVGLVLLARVERRPDTGRRVAAAWCGLELAGVVTVGVLSVGWPAWFRDDSVWSRFGQGYGFVPLVLPVLALAWLRRGVSNRFPESRA